MFRLIKYAFYALIAYCLYEMILGMTETRAAAAAPSAPVDAPPARPPVETSHPTSAVAQQLSGPSHQGAAVRVHDSGGTGRTQRVGRGVVRR